MSAAGYSETASLAQQGLFKIPNTFEARAAIGPVQDRIRQQRIAIIGLGGTGAYVLDLVAKTPVMEIHLLDFDEIKWHNFMRAPGAPTAEDIELRRKGRLRKVEYYHSKYASLREGIHPHAVRMDSPSAFSEFLSAHPIDYAFVCIDQLTDSDSPRQDVVYCSLSEAGIPFIDSGVSIMVEGRAVRGAVTTSAYDGAGSVAWKDGIPNATHIRVLFAKDAISTGWDCPRAEVLVSFRPAKGRYAHYAASWPDGSHAAGSPGSG